MTPRPDTSHWRRCDEEDCIVCRSRREEFEARARALCRAYGLPVVRTDRLDDRGTEALDGDEFVTQEEHNRRRSDGGGDGE